MTNKEAIKILSNMIHDDKAVYGDKPKLRSEALYLAIKVLEERPRGAWVFDSEFTEFGNPYGTYRCSICGCHSSNKYSFCKDCGADMRGGSENEIR